MPTPTIEPRATLGTGLYPRPDAARLLGMSPERLRRWVGGYTYWLRARQAGAARARRNRPPVVQTDLPALDGVVALTFLELVARFARHASASQAAVAYELELAQAEAAVAFEEQLAGA